MGGERHQINTQIVKGHIHVPNGLNRIREEYAAPGMGDFAQLTNGLNGPDFVVGKHNGGQNSIVTQRRF